jgi:hypothetical protein
MDLTDKQYKTIERYVGGLMEASEKEAFEVTLLQNNELAEEVEAYKEIVALADSLEQNIGELAQHTSEENTLNKEVWEMLEKERKYWEVNHEPELRHMHGLAGAAETTITTRVERQGKVIGLNRKRWMAAAVLIGLLGLGSLVWWNVQPERNKAAVAIHTKKAGKGVANNTVDDSAAKKQEASKHDLDDTEQQQLYAQNFVPDVPPQERTFLEDAFKYYEKGSYKQASIAYEEAQKEAEDLTTRSPDDEENEAEKKRILFYAHYYNALSCMAAGNVTKAIKELKAIKASPDEYWHSKKQWYMALAYIKTGEIATATTLLQQIATNKQAAEYSQKAIQLRKELLKE